MDQIENPYRRRLDPENGSVVLWVICTTLLLIVLISGFLYALSAQPTKYAPYQLKDDPPSNASRQ
jgi:hypothetical protein